MPLAQGTGAAVVSENIATLIDEGYPSEQAAAIAYKHAGQDEDESARVEDGNGWFEVERQPISRVGVFDYLGSKLPKSFGLDPDEFYQVLRPEEALSDPEFLDSIRLIPWIDDHTMLGPSEVGRTPAELKGVHGVTGEIVEYDPNDGIVYANIKCFSESQRDLIDEGKKELSLGYVCKYLKKAGEWNGQPYQFIQLQLRANHFASVDEGRMGSVIAVLDSADKPRGKTMDFDLSTMTLDDLAALIAAANEAKAKLDAATNTETEKTEEELAAEAAAAAGDDDDTDAGLVHERERVAMERRARELGENVTTDEDDANKSVTTDEDDANKSVTTDEDDGEAQDARDAAVFAKLARRDRLAARLKPFIGVFDHSAMTERQVAAHAVKKLGLHVTKGQEVSAVSAYLHGRPAPTSRTSTVRGEAMDGKDASGSSFVTRQLAGRK